MVLEVRDVSLMGEIQIEREGFLCYSWRAIGILRRAQTRGRTCILPTGLPWCVDEGTALTRWGARRQAQRALRRWT